MLSQIKIISSCAARCQASLAHLQTSLPHYQANLPQLKLYRWRLAALSCPQLTPGIEELAWIISYQLCWSHRSAGGVTYHWIEWWVGCLLHLVSDSIPIPSAPPYLKERFEFFHCSKPRSLLSSKNLAVKFPIHRSSFYTDSFISYKVSLMNLWHYFWYYYNATEPETQYLTLTIV